MAVFQATCSQEGKLVSFHINTLLLGLAAHFDSLFCSTYGIFPGGTNIIY